MLTSIAAILYVVGVVVAWALVLRRLCPTIDEAERRRRLVDKLNDSRRQTRR